MSDHLDEFDQWLRRDAYPTTWPDFEPQSLEGMRRAFEDQGAKLKLARGQRDYENTRKLDAVQVADRMRTQLDEAKTKASDLESLLDRSIAVAKRLKAEAFRREARLATLEAAVRAVRDDELIEWCDPDERVKELFALVPEVEL